MRRSILAFLFALAACAGDGGTVGIPAPGELSQALDQSSCVTAYTDSGGIYHVLNVNSGMATSSNYLNPLGSCAHGHDPACWFVYSTAQQENYDPPAHSPDSAITSQSGNMFPNYSINNYCYHSCNGVQSCSSCAGRYLNYWYTILWGNGSGCSTA